MSIFSQFSQDSDDGQRSSECLARELNALKVLHSNIMVQLGEAKAGRDSLAAELNRAKADAIEAYRRGFADGVAGLRARPIKCEECNGSGSGTKYPIQGCAKCDGDGWQAEGLNGAPAPPVAPKVRTWEIWTEGFRTNGESGRARFWGTRYTQTFKEACAQLWGSHESFDRDQMTFYGCRLYSSENDARRSFG